MLLKTTSAKAMRQEADEFTTPAPDSDTKLAIADTNGMDDESQDAAGESINDQDETIGSDEVESDDEPHSDDEPSQGGSNVDEDRWWAEMKILGHVTKIEARRFTLEEEKREAAEDVARAKSELKECESRLSDLHDEHADLGTDILNSVRKLLHLMSGKDLPDGIESGSLEYEDMPDDNAPDNEQPSTEAWRSVRLDDLFKNVKGISAKKMDSLYEVCATVGEFEDLRGEASKAFKEFNTVLPKGFGVGAAKILEDVVGDYMLEFARKLDDPDRKALAQKLVTEIREIADSSEWTADDCRPRESDNDHMHAGYSAFNEGRPYTDFISEDHAQAKSWMTGWVGAERLKQIEQVA